MSTFEGELTVQLTDTQVERAIELYLSTHLFSQPVKVQSLDVRRPRSSTDWDHIEVTVTSDTPEPSDPTDD